MWVDGMVVRVVWKLSSVCVENGGKGGNSLNTVVQGSNTRLQAITFNCAALNGQPQLRHFHIDSEYHDVPKV